MPGHEVRGSTVSSHAPMLRVGAHSQHALRTRIRSAAEEGKCTTPQCAYQNNGRRTVLLCAPTQSIGARKRPNVNRRHGRRIVRHAFPRSAWDRRQADLPFPRLFVSAFPSAQRSIPSINRAPHLRAPPAAHHSRPSPTLQTPATPRRWVSVDRSQGAPARG